MLPVEIIHLPFIVNRSGISLFGEKERCIYTFIFYSVKVQKMTPVMEDKGQIRKHQWSGIFYYLGLFKDGKEVSNYFFKRIGNVGTSN